MVPNVPPYCPYVFRQWMGNEEMNGYHTFHHYTEHTMDQAHQGPTFIQYKPHIQNSNIWTAASIDLCVLLPFKML